jgi:hypothetical protein
MEKFGGLILASVIEIGAHLQTLESERMRRKRRKNAALQNAGANFEASVELDHLERR